ETQRLFRSEARRLSDLRHPQLPQVLDHFALEPVGQYLVTTYVDGVDLQSLMAQYGLLPSDLIVGWLQAVARPLTYLHEKKQLHLDVKPANIRITPTGDLFLVDTGLPGLGIRPHADGYGAPEQQAQTAVTETADIYSLGATLYTLLTGQVPPKALGRESGLDELKPAREVNPDVEPYLSLVAARAMSLRPDTRYEEVADFARALQRPSGHPALAQDEQRRVPDTVRIAPPPRLPAATRKQMERRTIMGLAAVLLFILLGMAAFIFINLERPNLAIDEAEATATFVSAVIAAATQLAPTPTPTLPPTESPTPTPAPFISRTDARMIFMPAGPFRMGNDDAEDADEKPSHVIFLDAYFIDETEVTNAQYAQCVTAGVCDPPDRSSATYYSAYYGDSRFDNYPVIFVNWYDADAFCRWRDARLPSEAEWEKADGFDPVQGIKLRYPWGDAFNGQRLNYCDTNCSLGQRDTAYDDGYQDTAPVGSYPDGRSPIGLYDMSGNVMEWVADWYDFRYYENATETNPLGPLEGEFKVIRGGSWLSTADEINVTVRTSFDPTVSRANLGFRCAMNAP
ncbi:MAG: SUMF1/EgtB/PvdO family nonheme iron enzyme, partial [Anaerolineales bacterium]|nr:SUMF1/EgtB/PvdO family nonheme iron enzyme [Anaerolineales bacterium]